MRDFVSIGPTPCEEDCAQVGEDDYVVRAVPECRRFIELLRKIFGDEPPGARLAIKWFDHDFGRYCEVICWYETEDEKAREYAFRCENECPLTWEGGELADDDKKENEFSVANDLRILSAYTIKSGVRIWIITEADRSSTCVLLPSEY